jgi:superfamily I DNA/RNA helicase
LKLASLQDNIHFMFAPYDFILLDEAQDTNPVVYQLLLKSNRPIIAVGDIHQKIYGFRNAIDIMSDLRRSHNADVCYLNESFRFNQDIANIAYKILQSKPVFDSTDYPPIIGLGPKSLEDTKAIITRTNAGIVQIIANFYHKGVTRFYTYRTPSEIFSLPGAIAERFYGIKMSFKIPENIRKFVDSFPTKGELVKYANDACDVEIKRAVEITDKYYKILNELYSYHKRANLRKRGICILTAHTSKGLEFGNVEVYSDWELGNFKTDQLLQIIEEYNLLYVALTRAIHTLYDRYVTPFLLNTDEICIEPSSITIKNVFNGGFVCRIL